jgi:hypothetical protein
MQWNKFLNRIAMDKENCNLIFEKYFPGRWRTFAENEKILIFYSLLLNFCKIDYDKDLYNELQAKLKDKTPQIIRELNELLQDYDLSNWQGVFAELAIKQFRRNILNDFNKKYERKVRKIKDEETQIIKASMALNKKGVSSLKIVISDSKGKQDFVLYNPTLINHIGKLLYEKYYAEPVKDPSIIFLIEGDPIKGRQFSKSFLAMGWQKPWINPRNKRMQASLSRDIQNFLDNETELKRGNSFISNEQARFIYDFLELTDSLGIESSKVLKEEYIRTLLYNYKDKWAPGIG